VAPKINSLEFDLVGRGGADELAEAVEGGCSVVVFGEWRDVSQHVHTVVAIPY
jgi:hypothetical protein